MTFNVWTFLFEVLNFLVLAYVLHRLLYRPLRAAVERRQAENDRARTEAEAARKEADAAREALSAKLAAADKERQELLRRAAEEAQAEKAKRFSEAEAQANAVRDEARRDASEIRRDTLAALEGEVVGRAVGLAGRLVTEASDSSLNRQFTRRLLDAIRAVTTEERERVRRDAGGGDAVVESAAPLEDDLRKDLTAALQDLLGHPCGVKVEVKPTLLGGALARAGGHVWDATVAAQLAAAKAAVPEDDHGKPR